MAKRSTRPAGDSPAGPSPVVSSADPTSRGPRRKPATNPAPELTPSANGRDGAEATVVSSSSTSSADAAPVAPSRSVRAPKAAPSKVAASKPASPKAAAPKTAAPKAASAARTPRPTTKAVQSVGGSDTVTDTPSTSRRRSPAARTRPVPADGTAAAPEPPVIEAEVTAVSIDAEPGVVPALETPATAATAVAVEDAPVVTAPPVAAPLLDSTGSRSLRILMVASEVLPFSKTGGLADVAGALPGALGRLGHQVVVVTPRYKGIAVDDEPLAQFALTVGPEEYDVRLFARPIGENAVAWLVDIPSLFDRDGYYGVAGHDHPDNPRRFATLARAALEGALEVGFTPDLVHAHDWQGGLAPVYLRTRYANHPVLAGIPSVVTIHNIAYKGLCDPAWLPALDLAWELFSPHALEYWGHVSFLKAGISFSEKITTVSRRYAEEILTPEFAYGFEGILQARRHDLVGILNGVETDIWDPATDPHIPVPYTAQSLAGKREAKRALLQAYGLPSDDAALAVPLVGMVSRMIEQKGVDIIAEAAADLPHLGCRFVVLGTGEPRFEQMWRTLAAQFPDRIGARIGFDEGLSHLLEAGSDLFLMPSRFEPCGLNQMYSLRYGTLPLVRATGGLDDTVENYDPYTGEGNGFKFWEPSGAALVDTLRWALRVYEHPEVWQRLQRRGMAADFSWSRSAASYVEVYDAALARAGRARARA